MSRHSSPGSGRRWRHPAGAALACTFFCCLLPLLGIASAATVAEGEPTLAKGLVYKRLQTLPAASVLELPKTAVVIDLRGTQLADTDALRSVAAWVSASSQPPLRLVLIDSSTSSDVLQVLEARQRFLMTVGAASPAISPDVAVAVSLRADQDARDTLDAGKAPLELLASKVEKRRYDEAAMVRDHANGIPLPDSPPDLSDPDPTAQDATVPSTANPGGEKPVATAGSTATAPLYDAVLQRAVHVYQSLVALKRIPAE